VEQLCHVDQKLFNQSISLPHVEHVEPITTSMVVQQGVIYPQTTWPAKSMPSPSEKPQIPHHRLVS
jgi:hypothetical protein